MQARRLGSALTLGKEEHGTWHKKPRDITNYSVRSQPKLAGMGGFHGWQKRSQMRGSQTPQMHRQKCQRPFGEQSLARATDSAHTAAAVRADRAEITWVTTPEISYLGSDLVKLGPIGGNNSVWIVYLWPDKSRERVDGGRTIRKNG